MLDADLQAQIGVRGGGRVQACAPWLPECMPRMNVQLKTAKVVVCPPQAQGDQTVEQMQQQKQQQQQAQEQKAEIMNSILSTEAQQRRATTRYRRPALVTPARG